MFSVFKIIQCTVLKDSKLVLKTSKTLTYRTEIMKLKMIHTVCCIEF